MMQIRPYVVVEGIIGSGKSTLSKIIGERLNLRILHEPVDSNPYLTLFYQDPKRYAFAMQKLAAYEAVSPDTTYAGAILDRSMSGDRCFCHLHMLANNILELEWETYEMCHEVMACSLVPPSLMLFLDVDPKIALERIRERSRTAEVGIPISYLENLRNEYYDLMVEIEAGMHPWSRGMKVVKIPWNIPHQNPDKIIAIIEHHCSAKP
jgi:deoxyadenosine/deoxycytidine kinase